MEKKYQLVFIVKMRVSINYNSINKVRMRKIITVTVLFRKRARELVNDYNAKLSEKEGVKCSNKNFLLILIGSTFFAQKVCAKI